MSSLPAAPGAHRPARAARRRNCLFLTTTDEALLLACALVGLWREGFVEPMQPPPEPWHLVAQQAMALVLQEAGRLELGACRARLAGAFPELAQSGIQGLLGFMLESDILAEKDGLLGFGQRGERLYGRRHFLDLLSSFASPIQVQVRHGATELGAVDPIVAPKQRQGPLYPAAGRAELAGCERRLGQAAWPGWSRAGNRAGRAGWPVPAPWGMGFVRGSNGFCATADETCPYRNGHKPSSRG